MNEQVWRFADLQRNNIINNRTTLARWVKRHGFPPGIKLAENTRVWLPAEVIAWLESRR